MYARARFSIIFRRGDAGQCAICSKPVGNGPIGWHYIKGALCDACLIDEHQHLGLALVMANLLREFGQRSVPNARKERYLGAALMDAARLYHRASSKAWAMRRLDFLKELQASLEPSGEPHD